MYLENWVWWVIRMTQWVTTQEDVVRQIIESDTNDSISRMSKCYVLQCVVFQRRAVSWLVIQSWHNESWHSHDALSHDTRRRRASNSWVRYERFNFTYEWVQYLAVCCSVLQCVVFQRSAVSWVVTQSWHNESWHSHYAISHDTERCCASNSWVRYERCISRMDECSVLSQKDVVHRYDTGILRIVHVTHVNDFIHIHKAMIARIMTEWVTTQKNVVRPIVEWHVCESFHVWMSFSTCGWDISCMNELYLVWMSRFTHEWSCHVWMSLVTTGGTRQIIVSCMHESCHNKWRTWKPFCRVWMSHVTTGGTNQIW